MVRWRAFASLMLGGLLVFGAAVPPVDAAVLPLGVCTPEALRALINGAANGDVLLLPACTIPVAGASGDDANASGDFDIATSITLQGVGPDATILDGGGLDRVLDVRPGATVVVADLTIRNGAPPSTEDGGGIRNEGVLTLLDVLVTRNTGRVGGGILNASNTAVLTVLRSRITDNAGIAGGGITGDTGSVLLVDVSTVAGNRAGIGGGGIHVANGTATVRNSTIADNSTAQTGGGIAAVGG